MAGYHTELHTDFRLRRTWRHKFRNLFFGDVQALKYDTGYSRGNIWI